MISDRQKRIYNLYLRAYRTNNNQPFRAKKKFEDLDKKPDIISYLEKIDKLFIKYPAFFNDTFFNAPYILYPEEKKYFPLKFFASQKGISTCIAYYKILIKADPENQFEYFRESFKFIAEFCIEKNIELSQYTGYCSVAQNDCLRHLKEHKISWYVIFSIDKFYDLLYSMPSDEFGLYYGEDIDLVELYQKYQNSTKTQKFISELKKKVSLYVRKILENKRKSDK